MRILFDVLSATSILVLLTSGLAIVAGMMRIFNLAHGEFVLLGAVITYAVYEQGWPLWLGIPFSVVGLFLFGVLLEKTIIRRLYSRPLDAILITWALAIMIRGMVTLGLGGASGQNVPYPVSGSIDIAGTGISLWRLIIIGATIAVIVLLLVLIKATPAGLIVRASLGNQELARFSGIRTERVFSITFGVGSALAGLTGAFIVPLASLAPTLGVNYLVNSFMSLMVGGLGSIGAATTGASVVGASDSILAFIIGPSFSGALVLFLAVVLMRFRPQGIIK